MKTPLVDIKLPIFLLGLFNVFDAAVTYWVITTNRGIEMNPLMAAAINVSPVFFLFVKLTLIAISIFIFYKASFFSKSTIIVWIGVVIYGILVVHEIIGLCHIFRSMH